MNFGDKVMTRSLELGWTQEELASRMGYKSKSTINKIELGINTVPMQKVAKFAAALGTTSAYLMELDKESSSDIYDRIRHRREQLGMSQEELAHKIGYKDRTAVSKIESAQRQIKHSMIAKLADALGTTPSYLMGWDGANDDFALDDRLQMGKKIRESRMNLKFSQQQLAESVGYTDKSAISLIESGKIDIPYSKIVQLAAVLGTTPSYLVGGNKEDDALKEQPLTRRKELTLDDMTIGERIKNRRTSLGISQVSLADKVGISNQSLYKYENGIITSIPSDKISQFAVVLDTTPAYLMGWDMKGEDTTLEEKLLTRYRELDDLDQAMVRRLLKCDEDFNRI